MRMVHQTWIGLLCLDVVLLAACSGGVDFPQESAVEDGAHDIGGTESERAEAQEADELARLQLPLRAPEPGAGGPDCGGLCVDGSDPCAAIRCLPGYECRSRGDEARCVPIADPCSLVRCMAGTVCESNGKRARCV